jgi:hypothetical protein
MNPKPLAPVESQALAVLVEDNGICRLLLWPRTPVSEAIYAVYDLRKDCCHLTKSVCQARKLFCRWTLRNREDMA